MADAYLGQLSLVAFNFNPCGPYNWLPAAGQILSIYQFSALFSLLGTMYGGDGRSTFGLPNLQGNVAVGFGQGPNLQNYVQGETGGQTTVTLQPPQSANHTHVPMGASHPASPTLPATNAFAEPASNLPIYSKSTSPLSQMSGSDVSFVGGNGPHNNLMPFLGLNWIIAITGIFPPRS